MVWKRKLSFFSQFCEKLSASDWAACRATFRSSNFRCLLSVWVYQSLAYLLGRFGPNLFTVLFQFIEVCRLFLMLSSLEIPPQHFSQAEWLQHLSFLFQSFCWSSYLTPDICMYRGVHGRLNDCKAPRSCVYKTSPNRPSTTVLESWSEVFLCLFGFCQTRHCALWPDISTLF